MERSNLYFILMPFGLYALYPLTHVSEFEVGASSRACIFLAVRGFNIDSLIV